MNFTIGVTYWPRRKATRWWQTFDRGEVEEELAHVAALGCHLVRIPLLWSTVQPTADRLDHRILDRLGEALDAAHAAGLLAVVDLQVGPACGAFDFPDWAMDPLPIAVLSGGSPALPVRQIVHGREEARYRLRDPFEDEKMIQAQRRLFREVIGFYADHPAMFGWSLGHELDRARPPRAADAASEWLERRTAEIREVAEAARLFWYSDLAAFARPTGMRLDAVAAVLGTVAIEVHPGLHSLAEHPLDIELVRFTVALARALALETPVWVTGCAVPTVPIPGDPGTMLMDVVDGYEREVYFASESEQEEFVEQVLEALIADGAAGCWLGYYADFEESLWEEPPLDRGQRGRALGIVRRDGSEKPAAEAIRRVRKRLDMGQLNPGQPERRLEMDPEEYWREPGRHLRRLYNEYREGGHQ
ncbi:MAG: beta-galactosidase [Anaerolineae bacterium]|nr:beta-galactosidase [Anaerolineae bacterium]MDW8100178.1 beta-galactosidase [Anaerolineae bacterium]